MTGVVRRFVLLAGLLLPAVVSSCVQQTPVEPVVVVKPRPDAYELFVRKHKKYPRTMEIYRNKELLAKATPYSPIYICLSQQRGRLYVDGRVAADWPVSTGVAKHPTPTGTFRVTEKKRSYASRTWGKILDAEGKCVNSNADSRTDEIPEGGTFVGSPMPNWQRLTGNGIGMHTGKVRAGRRLSHGCIRTPSLMARQLFGITATGKTKVTITSDVEACYPTFVGTEEETAPAAATAPGAVQSPLPAVAQQQPAPVQQVASQPAEQVQNSPVEQRQPAAAQVHRISTR